MNRVSSIRTVLLAVAVLVCFSFASFAQSDLGSISGFVKDPTGATIPNAKVTARNLTGLERTVTTNESGYYTITNIPPGEYVISVQAAGFKGFQTTGVKLDPSSNLAVDAALTVGSASESVEVVASAVALQTESASVQKLITRQQIDALELNGRNPVNMASLVPGARGGNLSGLSFAFGQGPSNFNGSRNPENLITYDGAPATRTRSNGTSLGSADVDSTSEIQILTAAYAAEYGRTSGAQIRILTRSGNRDFHGAAYEYVRNNIFNANTWTRNHTPDIPGMVPNSTVAPFRYNQFGFNVSGPFFIPGKLNKDRNKFFWYWGNEWVRYRYLDTSSWTVPTMKMRQGDFSELLSTGFPNILGKVVQLKDPTTGAAIPGNIIPVSLRSPSGLGILKAYPEPNLDRFISGTTNMYLTALHPQNQRKDTLSADMNLTDNQRIQFRRMNYKFWEYQPLDATPGRTPKFFDRPNQTNSLNYVWTLSPTLINEAQATVSLDDVYIPVDEANFFDRTKAGIVYPYIFPQGKLIPTRIPTANVTSINGLNGGPYPSHSSGPIYTLSDSLTWIKGSHTLKFGMYYERSGENDNDEINVSACPTCTNNQNGQFLFTDTRPGGSGNAIGNVAMGLFDSYSELGQRAYTLFRGSSFEPFVQDSWKVNQKLTLNYGARYTVIVPYSATWRNMIVFDPALYDPAKAVTVNPKDGTITVGNGDRYNGMVIPGDGWPDSAKGRVPEATMSQYDYLFRGGKYPSYYSNIQWGQIQPRFGFAYQMTPKTVIRAGGGEFFTRLGVSDSIFLGGNPPFQPTANVTFGKIEDLANASSRVLPLTVTTQSRAFHNPSAWNWNATVEREIFWNSVVSVGYVGRRGLHLQREANINQPPIDWVKNNPGINLDAIRPYKGYNSIRMTDNVGKSMYNSLQATWNRRFSSGLLFGASYTLGHSTDDGSAQRDIIPYTYDASNLWGNSSYDVRHIFIANWLYQLPFLRSQTSLLGKIAGGWEISGIYQAQTGTPASVAKGNDYAGVGYDASMESNMGNLWAFNGADVNYTKEIALNGQTDQKWWIYPYDSNGKLLWSQPAAGTFVLQKGLRNMIYQPGFWNVNAGLFKKFAINERTGFQFRAEGFNVFNHPNWSGPGGDPTNLNTFGKITGKSGDIRTLQLSLRYYF